MKRIFKRTSLTTVILLSGLLFSLPRLVGAQVGTIVEAVVGSVASLVIPIAMLLSYIVNHIIGIAFSVASYLVELALAINDLILTQSNSLVPVGWGIARDLANLGFVLIIIIIAFAVILRIERYGNQKLLVRLIAAAILVNFSLAIAGVIISFASTISHFFLDFILGAENSGFRVADIIGGAFAPQRFLIQDPNPLPPDPSAQAGFFTSLSTAALVSIANLIFGGIFMLIATVVMATLAFMLLIRYIVLSFLLVVSPITWLFWVIPDLQGQASKWWSKFLEWVFFAPAVSFFIYLSIIAAQKIGELPISVNSDFVFPALANTIMQGAQMILLAGIMLGGLIAAKNMGITGAAGAMNLLDKGKRATLGWAGRKAQQAATRPLRGKFGKDLADKMETLGQNRGFFLRTLSRPIREMGVGMAKARMVGEKQVEDAKKGLPKPIDEQARRFNTYDSAEKVAVLSNIGKKLSDVTKRHGTKDAADRKARDAEENVKALESQLEKTQPLNERAELEARINEAKAAKKAATDGLEAWQELERVLGSLPETARKEFEKGGYRVEHTKIGDLYGKRPGERGYVMPGESNFDKFKELAKEVAKEGNEGAKEGGAEKKEEKK